MRDVALLILCMLCAGCSACVPSDKSDRRGGEPVIVFKHGKIAGDQDQFELLLKKFEQKTGITVKDEVLPASTDEQHQFYVVNLEGKSSDFDVLSIDVIWVEEFARAGWLRDVTRLLPEKEREEFFPGPLQAVTYRGHVFAIPWYIDAGVLYYRSDLLMKYGFSPPKTLNELVATAEYIDLPPIIVPHRE